ncbi:MAG: Pullulanase family protein [Bacteroidetes bacterium]|jgi:hypothetical protein|nr:Pullulanase family protein [Bacteroidota bacterium]
MKKNLLLLLVSLAFISLHAQVGFHMHDKNIYGFAFWNPDSVYAVTTDKSIMLINSFTKEWKYINSYNLPSYGTPVLKNKNKGAYLAPTTGFVVSTTDGWQTTTTASVGLGYLGSSPAGYYGFNKLGTNSYTLQFSPDGVTWNLAEATGGIVTMRNFGNKVYAFGAGSQSYVSLNGGQTYTSVANTGTFLGTFAGFHMASADTFIVLMTNTLCKSFDGGTTWTNTPLPASISSGAFKNKNEFSIRPTGGAATFSYTQDGGATWTVCATAPPANSGGQLAYMGNNLHFFPGNRTSDFGATWEQMLPIFLCAEFDMYYNATNNIFLSGNATGKYSYSVNKGRSFPTFTNSIASNQDMMAVRVLNNGTFLGGDRRGQVFTSSNNGQSWTQKNSEIANWNALKFHVSSNETNIVLSRAGQPVVSIDGGLTFTVLSMGGGNHIQSIKPDGTFLDLKETAGWELRKFDAAASTTVLNSYTATSTEYIAALHMADNSIGYIVTTDNVTKNNKIYKTTDGWASFSPKTDITPVNAGTANYTGNVIGGNIAFVQSFGPDTIIITGNNNSFYHITKDGGNTWSTITVPFTPHKIYRMHFLTSSTYMAIVSYTNGSQKGVYLNTHGGSGGPIGINEISAKQIQNNLVIYPNPGQSGERITIPDLENGSQINVIDINGRVVQTLTSQSESFTIENLNPGLYFVQVKEKNKQTRTAKLIIH